MESVRDPKTDDEIGWDGKTVWVNSGQDGSNIGRFSRFGVDVHATVTKQLETGKQCLNCSADGSIDGWDAFCELMRKHHRVTIPKEARPKHLDGFDDDRSCISCGFSWSTKRLGQGSLCERCLSRNVTNMRTI